MSSLEKCLKQVRDNPNWREIFRQAGYAPEEREINIQMHSVPITAKSRKLKVKWSPQLADDLNAYHSLDAEQELTKHLADEIAKEVDKEIFKNIIEESNKKWKELHAKNL